MPDAILITARLLPSRRRYERGKLIIFVSSQDRCDTLFRDLLRAGYPALRLVAGPAWRVDAVGHGCGSGFGCGVGTRACLPCRGVPATWPSSLRNLSGSCCNLAATLMQPAWRKTTWDAPALNLTLFPPCSCGCSLHGGKDQSDRESTIADFKANVCNILTATSGGWRRHTWLQAL